MIFKHFVKSMAEQGNRLYREVEIMGFNVRFMHRGLRMGEAGGEVGRDAERV